jgi:hypothetical protein
MDMGLNIWQIFLMNRLQADYLTESFPAADLGFLGSVDTEKLAFTMTIFMAAISILIDTVEITTSVITGDYSEQLVRVLKRVLEGVPPLEKEQINVDDLI